MSGGEFQSESPEPGRRRPMRRRRRAEDDDDYDEDLDVYDDPVQTLVPYKNARALVAYYLGVFSFLCVIGLVLGPAAVVFGVLGYRYGKAHPKAKGTGHAVAGILFGIMGTLLNGIGLAVACSYMFGWGGWWGPRGAAR